MKGHANEELNNSAIYKSDKAVSRREFICIIYCTSWWWGLVQGSKNLWNNGKNET